MSKFIQLHLLTSYPPANLNRDDMGRPKTAMMGSATRLRISSQSLKRAWRTSELFKQGLAGHMGVRTKAMGVEIYQKLLEKSVNEKLAFDSAQLIAGQFGKLKTISKKEQKAQNDAEGSTPEQNKLITLHIEQLAHFSPEEEQAIQQLIDDIAQTQKKPEADQLVLLRKAHTAADIALFGRMLASSPAYNTEAAAQVAHAISVHKVEVENDFFTAVDDLNKHEEDAGAGHLGETEFSAGLFYQYICIDRELLQENLSGDQALINKTIAALIEAAATIAPTGKQNSFASRARSSYLRCEWGTQQPRSLSVAYLKPVRGENMLPQAIRALEDTAQKFNQAYGDCYQGLASFNTESGEGNLQAVIQSVISATE